MAKTVSAPLVVAKRQDGSQVYLYQGSPLPENLADGEADRLAEFLSVDEKPSARKSSSK